jgi:hypothetical protein
MCRIGLFAATAVLAGFWMTSHVLAQTAPPATQKQIVQTIDVAKGSCSREIRKYCSHVKEGQGRLAACLYAHSDRLSLKCGDAIVKMGAQLQSIFTGLVNVVSACEVDAVRLCNGVVAGDGQLIGCLIKSKTTVTAPCSSAIDAAGLR